MRQSLFWKKCRALSAGLLAAVLAIPQMPVIPVQAADRTEITEEALAANDNILYLVNCGTTDVTAVETGYKLGLCQSGTDQRIGEDAGTGYTWGLDADDENTAAVSNADENAPDSLKNNCIYMSDAATYESGKSGFHYSFELPDSIGTAYSVTVGIHNPWSQWGKKYEDILIEGKSVKTSLLAQDFEETYVANVTDGVLDVFVQANPSKRNSTDDDPVLNYIIVRKMVVPNYTSISGTNGAQLYDTSGAKIQAHGGQIQQFTVNGETKWYWYGEDKTNGYRPVEGVHLYTSTDLYNWQDEGLALRAIPVSADEYGKNLTNLDIFTSDEYFKDLYGDYAGKDADDTALYPQGKLQETYWNLAEDRCVIERPKVIYNQTTGKYVMWFHADGRTPQNTADYGKADAGVAIADSPAGPFKLLGTYDLYYDKTFDYAKVSDHAGAVRDMNLFVDTDGTAYISYSSEMNQTTYIGKLNADYTGLAADPENAVEGTHYTRNFIAARREASAMFLYDGKYYMITSGCSGWAPNQANYAVADTPLGPWTTKGDPCVGDTNKTTFDTQSTCVFPVDVAAGKYIYMGDRWMNPDKGGDLSDSRYVWLPVEFGADDTILLKEYKNWTLADLENKGKVVINTQLPDTASSINALRAALPTALDVTLGGQNYPQTRVNWTVDATSEAVVGTVQVIGTLQELHQKEFTFSVCICPKGVQYLVDCGTNITDESVGSNVTSNVFDTVKSQVTLKNTVSDQAYDASSGWGYTGSTTDDIGQRNGTDFYGCGWWARENKNIQYAFSLAPGEYTVSTGYQEWWNTSRPQQVEIVSEADDGTRTTLNSSSFTLASSDVHKQVDTAITVPDGSQKIYVTVKKTGTTDPDPVLSWIAISTPVEEEVTLGGANTYYVDAQNGSDSNDGLSPETAWKTLTQASKVNKLTAGGAILLKAGCVWNDEQFTVRNAKGTKEQPVIIGRYGEGADPVINGNGNSWLSNKKVSKQDASVVHIYNSQYITVQNLEVTNWESDAADLMGETNDKVIYDQSKYLLTGILVENHDAGNLNGVVLKNNYVHDVNGYMQGGAEKGAGGIIALVTGGDVTSYFTDLTITGNKVEKVSHEAIYMESCFAARTLVGGANSQDAGKLDWVGWPNVYVADNYVYETAGDGIVLINADGGVAEHNLVLRSASENWNYSRNPAHAALWMWDCNNVTMQYNECAYTETTQDGMAFDCDYGNQNVMYQYNYSHHNKGGFWMACPGPYYTANAVVRYNLSVNDGLFDSSRIIRVGESGAIGQQVYNNTIYWNTNYKLNVIEQGSWGTPPSGGTDIYNNIFYGDSNAAVSVTNNDGINYDNNLVYGNVAKVYPIDEDQNAIVADPKLVSTDVNSYTTGTFAAGKVTLGRADGLQLQADSPCIDAGRDYMDVPQESREALASELIATHITLPGVDYAGNAVPYQGGKVDIGAFEYQGERETGAETTVNTTYLQSLIAMAEKYQETNFTSETYQELQTALQAAKAALEKPELTQALVDLYAQKLETAVKNLQRSGEKILNDPQTAENVLAAMNTDEKDNSGFEKAASAWGNWQSTVAATMEKKHSGEQSWKVTQTESGKTAYSEIGNVPVKPNTEYVCEAWVTGSAISGITMEAKHHNHVTSDKLDHKLASACADTGVTDETGWTKVTFEFTTEGYETISMSINSDLNVAYLDDVKLYEKYTIKEVEKPDTTALEEALSLVPEKAQSAYTTASWAAYEAARQQANMTLIDACAAAETIAAAAQALRDAFADLVEKETSTGGSGEEENPQKPSSGSGSGGSDSGNSGSGNSGSGNSGSGNSGSGNSGSGNSGSGNSDSGSSGDGNKPADPKPSGDSSAPETEVIKHEDGSTTEKTVIQDKDADVTVTVTVKKDAAGEILSAKASMSVTAENKKTATILICTQNSGHIFMN